MTDTPPPESSFEPSGGRLPSLSALELLVAVAESGSLGRAAARFGISQPAASDRMRRLERDLGVQLLHRSPTGSRPTAMGLVVTDWARKVVESAHVLVEGAAALKSQQAGRVRLVASLTLAEYLLPHWLVALRRSRPGAQVGLEVTNSSRVIGALRHDDADLGFVEGPWVPRDLRTEVVGHDHLVVVTAPGHPWTRTSRPVTGAELAATPLLLREAGSGTRETLEHALRPYDGVSVPLLELGATAPLRSAAAAGTGPAVLSSLAVHQDVAAGRLVEVPVDESLSLARVLRAVWRPDRELPEAARHLLDIARLPPGPRDG